MALSLGDLVFVRAGPPRSDVITELGVIMSNPYKLPAVGTVVDVWISGELRHILREAIAPVCTKYTV